MGMFERGFTAITLCTLACTTCLATPAMAQQLQPTSVVVTPTGTQQTTQVTISPAPAQPEAPAPYDEDYIRLGVEGFYDRYREPSLDVTEKSGYGSITGGYTYEWAEGYMAAVDARASYGRDDYSSGSGTINNIPQWEYELRARAGIILWDDSDSKLTTYSGLGARYFDDRNKGGVSNIGIPAYERRITQIYLPLGVTYDEQLGNGWTISPTVEGDLLLWGNVNSRLGNTGSLCFGYPYGCATGNTYPNNTQDTGYGLRSDLMLRKTIDSTTSFEFGPFVRYWNIHQSQNVTIPLSTPGYYLVVDEPTNNRLQAGLKFSLLW